MRRPPESEAGAGVVQTQVAESGRSRAEARVERAIGATVRLAARRCALVVAVALAVSAAAGVYAARNLGVQADLTALVSTPAIEATRRFEALFPLASRRVLLLVVDAPTPEAAADAADLLGARIAAEPEAFRGVFVPRGGPFFERHALLYLGLDELDRLTEEIAAAQPFLAEIARDPSLAGVLRPLETLARAAAEGDVPADEAAERLEAAAASLEAALEGRAGETLWADRLVGATPLEDATRRVVVAEPRLDFGDLQPARSALERVRGVIGELGFDGGPVRVRVTGDFALSFEEMQSVRTQAAGAGIASFALVAAILGFGLRSLRLISATLITLVAGLVCSLGFAAAAVGHLNPISVAFAVLFIGLSVDFSIHFCLRYRELHDPGQPVAPALEATARSVGGSLALCALTTALGFYAFLPTAFRGVAELGLIAGTGMFISLLFSLTLLPALVALLPGRAPRDRAPVPAPEPPPGAARRRTAVRVGAAAALAGALALVPRAHFDPNPLHVRDPSTESVQAARDLLESSRTAPWTLSVLAEDFDEAARVAERLEALPQVARALTLDDLVPTDQEEKLALLEEMALFVGPPPRRDAASGPEAVRARLAGLIEEAGALRRAGDPALRDAAAHLADVAARVAARLPAEGAARGEALDALEARLVEPILWRLDRLRDALGAGPVTRARLPETLRSLGVAPDGRVRVSVLPEENLADPRNLADFVDAVAAQEPGAVGNARTLLESSRAVVRSFQQALAGAAVAIGALLLLLWRRVGDAAVVLGVLGLAAALTVAGAVLAGIPFNYADVIVLPLLLGIGVDSSIHLVHRHRREALHAAALRETSTGRAIVLSALTTVASFGTLGFARHMGIASLGQLLTLGVVVMLVCNLLVLPAFLSPLRPRPGRTRTPPR